MLVRYAWGPKKPVVNAAHLTVIGPPDMTRVRTEGLLPFSGRASLLVSR